MIDDRMPFEPAEPIPDAPSGLCVKCMKPLDAHNWDVQTPVCLGNFPLDPLKGPMGPIYWEKRE